MFLPGEDVRYTKKMLFLSISSIALKDPRYPTWWYISDLHPHLMAICEDMT